MEYQKQQSVRVRVEKRKGVYERLLLRESLRDVPTTEERVTNWDYGIES
jgi:hypothetical protein